MRLHVTHEGLECEVRLPPGFGAGSVVDIAELGDEGIEIGKELWVLAEHVGGRGAEPWHAGDCLFEEAPHLFLTEVVGKMHAEGGDRPDEFAQPLTAGGGFGGQHRAQGRELLKKLAVFSEDVPHDDRVWPVDRRHRSGLRGRKTFRTSIVGPV